MPPTWTTEQVLALAPDPSGATAGRELSGERSWSGTGLRADPGAVWGLCAGSGKSPYQVVVDLSGPAYRCSCPSRKLPCKHALGLLLLWSAGRVGTTDGTPSTAGTDGSAGPDVPDWAGSWLDGRVQRTERSTGPDPAAPADPAAAARRAQQRTDRVTAGADELDRWLLDQVRTGLAPMERAGYRPFDTVAARMVDAQAPGLAAGVRRLPAAVASGAGWPGRVLEELALLHLTTAAHGRLDDLPAPLAASVRREVGYPVSREDVLAGPPLHDRWQVLALRDRVEDRLTARRVWLRGVATGRYALLLSFAPTGQSGGGPVPDAGLVPGTTVEADLHLYPSAAPLRALVGARDGEPGPLGPVAGSTLTDAAAGWAAAVAADPWTRAWPVVVEVSVAAADTAGRGAQEDEPLRHAVDRDGRSTALIGPSDPLWRLLAVSGGGPVVVVGELTTTGLLPLSVLEGDRLVRL